MNVADGPASGSVNDPLVPTHSGWARRASDVSADQQQFEQSMARLDHRRDSAPANPEPPEPGPAVGYPPEAINRRCRTEPEVSWNLLARVYWAREARADIARHGVGWAEGHAEGLRIASALGSCTSDLMEQAVELTDRPNPYLAADAAWAVYENERPTAESTPSCVDDLDESIGNDLPMPAPFVPDEAAVVDLALERQNLEVLEAMAADQIRQAITDPYGVSGWDPPGPDSPIDPRAHAVAARLMANQKATEHVPCVSSTTAHRSSAAPAKSAGKTLSRRG